MELERSPSPRLLVTASLAATLACVLAGPFGTYALSVPARALFWLLLIGWNTAKWWGWFAWLGERADHLRGALVVTGLGAILLNALLPLEIDLAYRLLGVRAQLGWWSLFISAVLISASISAVAIVLRQPPSQLMPAAARPTDASADAAKPAGAATLALRAGLADLGAVRLALAEDHYLRLVLADGREPLLLHRFGDALLDLAGEDGAQISRSAWVAASMVRGAVRQGRRWCLVLADGRQLPVSASHLPAVRARGWLRVPL